MYVFCIRQSEQETSRNANFFKYFFFGIVFPGTFGYVFQNSQTETLLQNLKFRKLFQNQKRLILENIHP